MVNWTQLLIITALIYFDKLMVMDFTSPQFYSVPCHYLELFYFVQNYVPVASHGPLPSKLLVAEAPDDQLPV